MITIVAPVYNEENNIEEFYKRLKYIMKNIKEKHEIILVNDGSTDNTLEILNNLQKKDATVRIINFTRNFGHQAAIFAGMEYSSGDVIITLDSDLQDPPELIPKLIEKYKEGYDIVYAKRKKRNGEKFTKKLTAYLYYRILNLLSDINIPNDVGDYRLITKEVCEQIINMNDKNLYIRGMIAWTGYKSTFVMYERNERNQGKTKYTLTKMLNLAINGITSFSGKPLRISIHIGILTLIITTIYIIYALINKYYNNTVSGWTSIIAFTGYLGSIILINLGIQGIYISKIYTEINQRPLYIIKKKDMLYGKKRIYKNVKSL